MKNTAFAGLPPEAKKEKLAAVLREKTGYLLWEDEIKAIVRYANLAGQYSVFVYRDCGDMLSSVNHSPIGRALFLLGGEVVSKADLEKRLSAGMADNTTIAVIAKCMHGARRAVFIYIPPHRKERE